jgi:PHD/YefM family antitoxin component YafN of YafNO toxin-antitoxin module
VGEAMWAKEEVNTMSMVEELDLLRMTVNRKKVLAWRDECKKCEKQK